MQFLNHPTIDPLFASSCQTQSVPPGPLYRVSSWCLTVSVLHTNDSEDDTQVGDRRPQLIAPTQEPGTRQRHRILRNQKYNEWKSSLFLSETVQVTGIENPLDRSLCRDSAGANNDSSRWSKARQATPGQSLPSCPTPTGFWIFSIDPIFENWLFRRG